MSGLRAACSAWLPRLRHLRPFAAILAVLAAVLLRLLLLGALGIRAPWLTYYPAVMIAALVGGFAQGSLAILLSCLVVMYAWPVFGSIPFIKDPADWLGMGVFALNCSLISWMAASLRTARANAEAGSRAKGAFLANMSHELRSPLNAILGFSRILLRASDTTPEQRGKLESIHRSGQHLLELIEEVLDLARAEEGRLVLGRSAFALQAVAQDVFGMFRLKAEEKGLQLTLELPDDLPSAVWGDERRLRQILINLVSNALTHTQVGGVALRCRVVPAKEGVQLAIEVEDTGIGIAPADLERIFEPFVQLGQAASHRGTGLGLTITRRLVTLMGGTLRVESTVGVGTLFHLELPFAPAGADEAPPPPVLTTSLSLEGAGSFRILVVEDQLENSLLLEHILKEAGFQVRLAWNGLEGVHAFAEWQPHFIWMDQRMPMLSGTEAAQQIRALAGGRTVKIVALTASVFKEEREAILASGMDDLVRKPFRNEELFACMSRLLGAPVIETTGVVAAPGALPILPSAFGAIPPALLADLEQAVILADSVRVAVAIAAIEALAPSLGAALRNKADNLQFSAILTLVRRAKEAMS